MRKTRKKGFTIVELVIVIAVIAILAAVLIPTFTNVINKSKESASMQEARAVWYNYIASLSPSQLEGLNGMNGTIEYDGFHFVVKNGTFTAATKTAAESVTWVTGSDGQIPTETQQ